VLELQRSAREDRREAVVVVLVDDDDPQAPVLLGGEGVEEAPQLVGSADRRDDEVERRKLARHGP
jgi:hypothetical protein